MDSKDCIHLGHNRSEEPREHWYATAYNADNHLGFSSVGEVGEVVGGIMRSYNDDGVVYAKNGYKAGSADTILLAIKNKYNVRNQQRGGFLTRSP